MGVLWTPAYAGVTGFIGFAFGSVENGITISHNERISSLTWITAGADGCGMLLMNQQLSPKNAVKQSREI